MFSFRNAPNFTESQELKDQISGIYILKNHAQLIMKILGSVINGGNDKSGDLNGARRRGQAHKHSGMEMKHYDMAVQSMCIVIKDTLGSQYTPELDQAWHDYMGMFFGVMTRNVY